jgi:DNA-binding phage protein
MAPDNGPLGATMPNETPRELPMIQQLKDEIRGSGRSLKQLARDAGVGADQLSRFLRDERTLTLPAVAKICGALGLELVRRAPAQKRKRGAT